MDMQVRWYNIIFVKMISTSGATPAATAVTTSTPASSTSTAPSESVSVPPLSAADPSLQLIPASIQAASYRGSSSSKLLRDHSRWVFKSQLYCTRDNFALRVNLLLRVFVYCPLLEQHTRREQPPWEYVREKNRHTITSFYLRSNHITQW